MTSDKAGNMMRHTEIRTKLLPLLGFAAAVLVTVAGLSACKNPLAAGAKLIKDVAASPRLVVSGTDEVALASGASFDFGTASKGVAIDAVLTLKNSGPSGLSIDLAKISLTGAAPSNFSFDPPASRLAPGAQTTMGLHFITTESDIKTAILTIPTNDVTTPAYILKLTGRGTKAEISSFKVASTGSSPAATGVISGRNITLTLPFGVTNRALTPTIAYTGANISPLSGKEQDFTNPVTYTVTALDGLSQIFYTVTVVNAGNDAKEMTGFEFAGLSPAVVGTIDEGAHTVTAIVPYGTDVAHLTPSITHTGQSISPVSGVSTDFSSSVTYRITAGDSSHKDYTATVKVIPQTPTISSAVPGANKVDLSWSAASGATSYNLYWSTSSGVTTSSGTLIAGVTSPYTHTGLSPNANYYYILTSVKDGIESPASAVVSALTYPDPPAATKASIAGGGELVLSWTPPAAGASSYNVYYSTSAGVTKTGTKIAGLSGTSTTVTGLSNWTPYYFKVTAVNASGESDNLSNEISGTPAREEIILVNTGGSVDFNFINPATWTRTQPTPSFFPASNSVYSVAVDPGLNAVYAANNTANPSGYFSVGTYRPFGSSTGSAPAYVSGETHSEGAGADHLITVVTPGGNKFLYAAYKDSNLVYTYGINADGSLSLTGNQVTGLVTPRYLCADPAGKFLYISNIGSPGANGVTVCAINSTTGALTYINGGTTGSNPFRMAIHPSGKYLFVGNWGSSTVSAFTIGSDGKLTAVAGSPFACQTNPTGMAVDPSGTHLFVTCSGSPYYVSVYTIGGGGALSGRVDYTGGVNTPSCIAIDATGTYAVVTNAGSNNASVFAIDPATGVLTAKFAFGTGATPSHVIIVKLP
jgi:6-phosphogluconolactonase (cycloisomerase 2 family)